MKYEKSAIRRGMFLTSDGGLALVADLRPAHVIKSAATDHPPIQSVEIKLQLKELAHQHSVKSEPCVWPLDEPEAYDMILEGFASTPDVDRERMLLAPQALLPSPYQIERSKLAPVKLLWRHDEKQIAGEILDLHYDSKGRLFVRAKVTHDLGKRAPAFSVGISTIRDWEMVAPESKQFHALIKRATLDEISLTDRPANPNARVTFRCLTEEARATMLRMYPKGAFA